MNSIIDIQARFGYEPNEKKYVADHGEDASTVKTMCSIYQQHMPDVDIDVNVFPDGSEAIIVLTGTVTADEAEACKDATKGFKKPKSVQITNNIKLVPSRSTPAPSISN